MGCAQGLDLKPWKEQGVNQTSCSSRTLGYRGPTRVSWIKFSQKKTLRQGFHGTSFTGEVVLKTQKGCRGSGVGQRRQLIKVCSQACYNGGQLELSPTGTSSVLFLRRGEGVSIAGPKSQCWRAVLAVKFLSTSGLHPCLGRACACGQRRPLSPRCRGR